MADLFKREAQVVGGGGGTSGTPASPNVDSVVPYVPGTAYKNGDTVILALNGGQTLLYQCITTAEKTTTNPASDVAVSGGNWRQLTFAGIVVDYKYMQAYFRGDLVRYSPNNNRWPGVYQVTVLAVAQDITPVPASGVGLNPGWAEVVRPGPALIAEIDVLNPALSAVGAQANITGIRGAAGTALGAMTIRSGKRYRLTITEPRPANIGQSMATDSVVKLFAGCAEVLNADGTVTLTITPRWEAVSTAINVDLAAIAANTLTARICIEEI